MADMQSEHVLIRDREDYVQLECLGYGVLTLPREYLKEIYDMLGSLVEPPEVEVEPEPEPPWQPGEGKPPWAGGPDEPSYDHTAALEAKERKAEELAAAYAEPEYEMDESEDTSEDEWTEDTHAARAKKPGRKKK